MWYFSLETDALFCASMLIRKRFSTSPYLTTNLMSYLISPSPGTISTVGSPTFLPRFEYPGLTYRFRTSMSPIASIISGMLQPENSSIRFTRMFASTCGSASIVQTLSLYLRIFSSIVSIETDKFVLLILHLLAFKQEKKIKISMSNIPCLNIKK